MDPRSAAESYVTTNPTHFLKLTWNFHSSFRTDSKEILTELKTCNILTKELSPSKPFAKGGETTVIKYAKL